MTIYYATPFTTPMGQGRVLATDLGVCRVDLPEGPEHSSLTFETVPSSLTDQAAGMLMEYFSGTAQPFEHLPVDLSGITPFRKRILNLIRSIPYGEVRTYGDVGRMAGLEGAARAIGGAMAANPVPIIIPCHRVVASDGRLTGYTAPGGIPMKKFLLKIESIEFKGEKVLGCQKVINNFSIGVKILDTPFCKRTA